MAFVHQSWFSEFFCLSLPLFSRMKVLTNVYYNYINAEPSTIADWNFYISVNYN